MSAHWQAVALARQVQRKPVKIWFENMPVALFRAAGGVQALFDRCPHRFAELSAGRVVGDTVECPYHGWRFGVGGICTAIPGHLGDLPRVRVKSFAVAEVDGVIFIADGHPDAPPYTHCAAGQDVIVKQVISSTQSTLIDTAENILDATHTHFTHKGILRGLNSKRFTVDVEITRGPDWVAACYTGEDKQQGAVSKLLEGSRTRTIGRFKAPGIAELEYWGPDGLNLATTFHLRESRPGLVEGIGWLVGPRQGGLGHLKALFFKPFFTIALNQDRKVLRAALENAAHAPQAKPVIGPLDFLREDIARIIAGKQPKAADAPQHRQLEL